jgi:hypothetical protein
VNRDMIAWTERSSAWNGGSGARSRAEARPAPFFLSKGKAASRESAPALSLPMAYSFRCCRRTGRLPDAFDAFSVESTNDDGRTSLLAGARRSPDLINSSHLYPAPASADWSMR